MTRPHLFRWALSALGLTVLFGAATVAMPAPSASALTNCTVSATDVNLDAQEQQFLVLINNYRASIGATALKASTNLNRAAVWSGVDMGTNAYFSHTDSLGRSPSTRAQNCDYPGGAGENIAAGTNWDTAQEAFDAWKNSAGHDANMRNTSYRMIGIARVFVSGSPYGYYWITPFGLVDDGTGAGGGTVTPPPPPPPAATVAKAAMTSPVAGSTFTSASATFNWSAGTGAAAYHIYIGTTAGASNLVNSAMALTRTKAVTNMPANGSTVYVRLWTQFSTGWQFNDYTYKAFTATVAPAPAPPPPPPPATTATKATITSPAPGSQLSGGQAAFAWAPATGAIQYFLYVGTTQGGNTLFGASQALATSKTVTGLPVNGSTIWVRLWTRNAAGAWSFNDYSYVAGP